MSSRMRGPTAYKPTPSTCFPPPPPPVFPGFVPCFNSAWGSLASLRLDIRADSVGIVPPQTLIDSQTNVALVTKGAGLTAWTTTLNSPAMRRVQLGLQCVQTSYMGDRLQCMLMGTFVLPDFSEIDVSQFWDDPTNLRIATLDDPRTVKWNFFGQGQYRNQHWTLMILAATLSEISATPRSRPPAPMIPPIA